MNLVVENGSNAPKFVKGLRFPMVGLVKATVSSGEETGPSWTILLCTVRSTIEG